MNNIIKKCDLCGNSVEINEYGFGQCSNCGWNNDERSIDCPDEPSLSNFLSYNNAKKLLNQGKPLKPTFMEFLHVLKQYGEMQFVYNEKTYGIIRDDNIEMFCVGMKNSSKYFNTYEDFITNADINGILLKNLWDNVCKINFLQ